MMQYEKVLLVKDIRFKTIFINELSDDTTVKMNFFFYSYLIMFYLLHVIGFFVKHVYSFFFFLFIYIVLYRKIGYVIDTFKLTT